MCNIHKIFDEKHKAEEIMFQNERMINIHEPPFPKHNNNDKEKATWWWRPIEKGILKEILPWNLRASLILVKWLNMYKISLNQKFLWSGGF